MIILFYRYGSVHGFTFCEIVNENANWSVYCLEGKSVVESSIDTAYNKIYSQLYLCHRKR